MARLIKRFPEDAVHDSEDSPVGRLFYIASNKGLHWVLWQSDLRNSKIEKMVYSVKRNANQKYIKMAKTQLKEYFSGKRKVFDIPLVMDGTVFQEKAWEQLTKIPYGKTVSYQDQARALGDINKVRAVGGANGKNPFSIIVPCHRVIGKNGSLHGFGGGLSTKRMLIDLEKQY